MAINNFKANPGGIVKEHYRTYVDVRNGKRHWPDYFYMVLLPLAMAPACIAGNVKLPTGASVGLLTVSGLLGAFLFGVMLQISDRALNWSDTLPMPGPETSSHATYLTELAANSGYASLVSITAAALFVASSVSSGWTLRVLSSVGLAMSLHLAFILLMVMKRVFALTEQRLNRARTGADRQDSARRRVS